MVATAVADGVEVQITGLDELKATLEGVSYDTQRKGGRFALRKAAQVIREKAKANAMRLDDPETGRTIAANIAERWDGKFFRRTGGDMKSRIGVLGGSIRRATKGNPDTGAGGATPHAMLVELGTEHSRAQPYLRPAAEESVNQVVNTFVTEFDRHVERAIKRHAKKGTQA